jgi:AcrR family transcriptional regulator
MRERDPRVRRTQNALTSALIALTLERGYTAVSIRDITERAKVGYATFFRHYPGKDALLRDVLNVVVAEIVSLFQTPAATDEPIIASTMLFQYVKEREKVCRVLLGSNGAVPYIQEMIAAGVEKVVDDNVPRTGTDIPMEIAAHHLVASSISLIAWWLENGMPYTPERMGYIHHRLIWHPTSMIAFDPRRLPGSRDEVPDQEAIETESLSR